MPRRERIEHRLGRVGWKDDPHFEPGAFAAIYSASAGIPRRINTLCNRLLLGAYLAEQGAVQPGRLAISQGVELGRPSTLFVDVQRTDDGSWSIFVGGGVVRVGEGEFDLPD